MHLPELCGFQRELLLRVTKDGALELMKTLQMLARFRISRAVY